LTEPHFFRHPAALTVGEIASLTGAELQDVKTLAQRMTNVAPVDLAEAGDLTFVDNAKFAKALISTRAGAVFISEHLQCLVPSGLVVLLTPKPYKCFVLVARELYPDALSPSSLFETESVAANASARPFARLASRVTVRRRGQRNSISADMLAAVRQLVLIANNDLIAGILNQNGLVTGPAAIAGHGSGSPRSGRIIRSRSFGRRRMGTSHGLI
jgi:UDP-3-O-[3-hydroxymyristoyl] glucosamine N-acyltransferase